MPAKYTPEKLTAIFWSKVEKTDTCWLWSGRLNNNGYGVFTNLRAEPYAHRFAYQLEKGPIPLGLVLDHLCRVRHCVRPDHLEAVTTRVNLQRGEGFIGKHARATHCIHGHEFTPENTFYPKDRPTRVCLTCRRHRDRVRRPRKTEKPHG